MPGSHEPRAGYVASRVRLCEFCDRPVSTNIGQSALLPDSSMIHECDPELDGTRVAVACCGEHMDRLVLHAFAAWQDGQFWFGWLCRASRSPALRHASVVQLAEHVQLAMAELGAALAWNAGQPDPLATLPGGQRITTWSVVVISPRRR